jgi:hypothetical protein
MNALMAGLLYFMGTVFGVTGAIVGGEVLSSTVTAKPLISLNILSLVASNSSRLTMGSFLNFLMGISLVAMTVFLYPIFRKDSEELAIGMLLFRGALEGIAYFISTISILVLVALGNDYVSTGVDSAALQSMGNVLYQVQDILGPIGSILFLIGATCLYISFYRTRLIPRWLSIWGFVGVVPYLAYAVLHYFHMDHGRGFYLQMVLAPQEIVMGIWLILKGFNQEALKELIEL